MGTIKALRAEAVQRANDHFDKVCRARDLVVDLLSDDASSVLPMEAYETLIRVREDLRHEWKVALMAKQLARKGFDAFYPEED